MAANSSTHPTPAVSTLMNVHLAGHLAPAPSFLPTALQPCPSPPPSVHCVCLPNCYQYTALLPWTLPSPCAHLDRHGRQLCNVRHLVLPPHLAVHLPIQDHQRAGMWWVRGETRA